MLEVGYNSHCPSIRVGLFAGDQSNWYEKYPPDPSDPASGDQWPQDDNLIGVTIVLELKCEPPPPPPNPLFLVIRTFLF